MPHSLLPRRICGDRLLYSLIECAPITEPTNTTGKVSKSPSGTLVYSNRDDGQTALATIASGTSIDLMHTTAGLGNEMAECSVWSTIMAQTIERLLGYSTRTAARILPDVATVRA